MTDRSTQLDGPEDSDDDTFDQIKCLWISVISTCVLILALYVTLCACSKSELGGGNVRKPQKYTYSQHGNKCFKEEIRSLSKVGFVSKDKASFVRKDTTGT